MSDLDTKLADLEAVVGDFLTLHDRAVNTILTFATRDDFVADAVLTPAMANGARVYIQSYGGALLQKVASGGDIVKPSGDRWTVISRRASPRIFGAAGDGVTDDETAIRAINQSASVQVIDLEGLTYVFGTNFFADSNNKTFVDGQVSAGNGLVDFTPLAVRNIATSDDVADYDPEAPGIVADQLVDVTGLFTALADVIADIPVQIEAEREPDFVSGLLSINGGEQHVLLHGLGARPGRVEIVYVCVDEAGGLGWSYLDEVNADYVMSTWTSGTARSTGLAYASSDTTTRLQVAAGGGLGLLSATGGSNFVTPTSAWRIKVRMWR